MRKIIIAIAAFFYLSASSGFTLHLHYCMGKLADWGLWSNDGKTCGGCGMEKSDEKDNGCCKDEHKFVKNSTDQKIAESSLQLSGMMTMAILPVNAELYLPTISSLTEESPVSHAPPRCNGIAVYIRNCIFLI